MDSAQLADFLRTRRAALTPDDVGLPSGSRRRTAGLRREEVAALAMISTDYYSRMEQRRAPQPSTEVVMSLSRALRLSRDERDHLFRLSGHNAPERAAGGENISAPMARILERLHDTPAQVVSALAETLAQTPPARALLGDRSSYDGFARSVVYRWFTDDAARELHPEEDHAEISRSFVAAARVVYAREGVRSQAARIVDDLLQRSVEFAELWRRHDVRSATDYTKRILHPGLGLIEVQCQVLHDAATFHTLLVFTAEPGTASHTKLAALCADPEAYGHDTTPLSEATQAG